ncbi:MAG: PDZ domain-containing protein [bacterium]|nr:PDZ domain-containing protein [bacterium]
MMRCTWILAVLLCATPTARAQEEDHGRNAPAVLRMLQPHTAPLADSVATVLSNDAPVALATVVDSKGLLVTKASELVGLLSCSFGDGRTLPARIVAQDAGFDLALIAVEAKDLVPIRWDAADLAVGRVVASSGAAGRPLALGIVGVAPKTVLGGRGRLGVVLSFESQGAVVARVNADTAADAAGVQIGDRILAVDGVPVATRREATDAIRKRRAGESLRLTLGRGDEMVLAKLSLGRGSRERRARRSELQGEQSSVRAGFPSAFQHDTALLPEQCGGPVVDLRGRAVGLNIARAGRVATYAIPGSRVQALVEGLREGH